MWEFPPNCGDMPGKNSHVPHCTQMAGQKNTMIKLMIINQTWALTGTENMRRLQKKNKGYQRTNELRCPPIH